MEVVGQLLVLLVLVMLAVAVVADSKYYMFNCKFSNEGCESDDECCSGNCVQAHPGTNYRCTRSSLHKACLYTYQCEERLSCGPNNTCCSKYWGTCIHHKDCCYRNLFCLEAEGFYYKRCLMGKVDSPNRGSRSLISGNVFFFVFTERNNGHLWCLSIMVLIVWRVVIMQLVLSH